MLFRLNARTCLVAGLVCLQTADLLCTYLLLDGSHRSDVYEANPLARTILNSGGWAGVALFKFSLTLVAVLAALVVSRRRPAAAVRLLALLCAVMLGVNVYSGSLLASPPVEDASERQASESGDRLDRQIASTHEFCKVRETICDAVLDGECDPAEASSRLAAAISVYGPQMKVPPAARLPELSKDSEMLAYLNYHLRERAGERGLKNQLASLGGPVHNVDAPDLLSPLWLRIAIH